MFFSKKRSNARKSFRQNKCLPSAIPGHDLANRRHLLRLEPLEDRRMLSVAGVAENQALELFHTQDALFAENAGQWAADDVYFGYNKGGTQIYFTDDGLEFGLSRRELKDGVEAGDIDQMMPDQLEDSYDYTSTHFSLSFDGAAETVPVGADMAETAFNYHFGEQADWIDGVATYKTVVYDGLYDGIDLHTFSLHGQMKYEFHIDPGVDYSQIELSYDGIEGLSIGADGSLHIATELGEIVDEDLYIYQVIDGQEVEVAGQFTLLDADSYTFTVTGEYDPNVELVIDPNIEWGTYLGGSDIDRPQDIATDGLGNAYICGNTDSANWVSYGWDTSFGGDRDGFVVKLSSNGDHLWSTYLGGSNSDYAYAVSADSLGNVYVCGSTYSANWVSGGWDTNLGGSDDGFALKLSSNGNHIWSTYLGGSDYDYSNGIAVDDAGNVFVSGYTYSDNWVSGGWDTINDNSFYAEGFALKLSSNGDHLWSTYLGGSSWDYANDVALDAQGNVYVCGSTGSANWVSGGWDTSYDGSDGFVVKLSNVGSHLWSTYISEGHCQDIEVDTTGNALVIGNPPPMGHVDGADSDSETYGFVVKFSSTGSHTWSTILEGGNVGIGGIAIDSLDNVFVTGTTSSATWISGGWDTINDGYDGFVLKLNADGDHIWSSYLGGGVGNGIAIDAQGKILVTGYTGSSDWGTRNGWDTTYCGGLYDGFVIKIDEEASSIDTISPVASLESNMIVGFSDAMFSVTYSDNIGISATTIGTGDLIVIGPAGYSQYAELASIYENTGGAPRTAIYRVSSPGGEWTNGDNGTYQILMVADEVSDTSGNFVPAGLLGDFEVFTRDGKLMVDADASPGGNGATWGSAYDDLQDALTQAAALNSDDLIYNDIGQIWIAAGSYLPSSELEPGDARSASFSMVDGVRLYGGFAGDETSLEDRDFVTNVTTLSGDLGLVDDTSDNAYTVVYCGEGIGAGLDGVTITDGNADRSYDSDNPGRNSGGGIYNKGNLALTSSTLSDNSASSGGGIYNIATSDGIATLTVTGSTISGNSASSGGGILNIATSDGIAMLTITDCTISGNSANSSGGGIRNSGGMLTVNDSTISGNSASSGGGIRNSGGTLTVNDSTLSGNSASYQGGGIYNSSGTMAVTGSTISGNSAEYDGSGIGDFDDGSGGGIYNSGTMTVTSSTISGNSAEHDGSGGGISNYFGTLTVTGSTLFGNSAFYKGGGIYNNEGTVTIINSTISDNMASQGGGILNYSFDETATLTITNSTLSSNLAECGGGISSVGISPVATLYNTIVAGNVAPSVPDINGNGTISGSHNLIGDGTGQDSLVDGTDDNIVGTASSPIDPMFSDLTQFANGQWGYYLMSGSPAIDAGDNSLAVDATGQPLTEDISGNPRIVNSTVDIGAVEGATSPGIGAQTYLVTSLDETIANDGILTFVEAFEAAQSNQPVGDASGGSYSEQDIIQFADSLSGTILVDDGQLLIFGDLSIEGPGEGLITFDATGQNRVFSINPNVSVALSGITVTGGSAKSSGGGIYNYGTLTVTGSIISGNSAEGDDSRGGGIYNNGGTLTVTDSTLLGNSVEGDGSRGGGISNDGGVLTVTSSTLSGNSAEGGNFSIGGGIVNENGSAIINNTIVAGNIAMFATDIASLAPATISGSHNLIGDGTALSNLVDGIDGNIVGTTASPIDPMFVDPASGDYRLLPGSLAIDTGDASLLPADSFDLDGDGDFTEPLPLDLAGNPRINGLALDIGAYESVPLLSGDANLDGQVTTADLAAVAGHWQQATTAGRAEGDFNGDGVVTAADLAAVSGNWQDSLTMVVSPIADMVLWPKAIRNRH